MKRRGEVENMKLKKAKNGIEVIGKKKNAKASSIGIVAITSALVLVGTLLFGVVGIASAQQTLPKGGDSFETAVELQPGSYVTDHKISIDAPEYFKLPPVKAGQELSVKITNNPDIASATSSTILYDEDGTECSHPSGGKPRVCNWLMSSEKILYRFYMCTGCGENYITTKGTRYDISIEDCFDAGSQTDVGGTIETAMEITEGEHEGCVGVSPLG